MLEKCSEREMGEMNEKSFNAKVYKHQVYPSLKFMCFLYVGMNPSFASEMSSTTTPNQKPKGAKNLLKCRMPWDSLLLADGNRTTIIYFHLSRANVRSLFSNLKVRMKPETRKVMRNPRSRRDFRDQRIYVEHWKGGGCVPCSMTVTSRQSLQN